MSRVFFCADTHFGHDRLAMRCRGMDPTYHNELIINNWNKAVNKKDVVIIVGDLTFESPELIPLYLSRLHGNKVLIAGNHDTSQCCDIARSLGVRVMGCMRYKGFFVSHIPIHPLEFSFNRKVQGNIHGHIHEKIINDPRYFNVSMDVIDFTPILFDDIQTIFQLSKMYR